MSAHRFRGVALGVAIGLGIGGTLGATTELAHAGGLHFTDRGVRPVGRGGAFVAGADDINATWYNPAGLVDAGSSILVDFAWLHHRATYTRQTQVADASGTLRVVDSPTVDGTTPFIPIPTLGGSYAFGDKKQYVAAFSVHAPYTPLSTYPLTVNGEPAASRYSLVTLDGSLLVVAGAFFAFRPIEMLSFGGGFQMLMGSFKTQVVFSANPADRLIGAPEDPAYDALSQLNVGPIFAPSANFGVIFTPMDYLRIGLSGQLPFTIDAGAEVKVRLPRAPEFDRAYQQGSEGNVRFSLPGSIRAGVEIRPTKDLRLEAAYVREFWSVHKSIELTPRDMKLYNVTGFPSPFNVSSMTIQRNFQDADSFRVGAEYKADVGPVAIEGRTGLSYDTSAVPNDYVCPLTIDSWKVTLSFGASVHIAQNWRLDASYSHVFMGDVEVNPADAKVQRVNPVRGNPATTETHNGGKYSVTADLIGLGMRYKF